MAISGFVAHSPSRPLTYADLESAPDDGFRRELCHGALLVTPSPIVRHQVVVSNLIRLLHAGCPDGYVAIPAPCYWYLAEDTVFIPDVMIVAVVDPSAKRIEEPPLLVVEVLSPSTASFDQVLKRHEYARGGAERYWIVDTATRSILCLRLENGVYVEEAALAGEETLRIDTPFAVTVSPADVFD